MVPFSVASLVWWLSHMAGLQPTWDPLLWGMLGFLALVDSGLHFKSMHAIGHIKMKLLSHPWHDLYPTTKGLLTLIVCVLTPPSSHPLTGPPTLGTPSASRAVLEMKPNCSWQFTPKESEGWRQEMGLLLWAFSSERHLCLLVGKWALGKHPSPANKLVLYSVPSLC